MGLFSIIKGLTNTCRSVARMLTPSHIPVAFKLAFAISLLITLGMGLLGSVIIKNQTELLQAQINSHGQSIARQMANSAKEFILSGDNLGLSILARDLTVDENIYGTAILDNKGKLVSAAGNIPFSSIDDVKLHQNVFSTTDIRTLTWTNQLATGSEQIPFISFISPVNTHDVTAGYILVTFSHETLDKALSDSIRSILAATILMIALAIIISIIMSQRLSRPIHNLMNASKALGQGKLDVRISERRNDELGFLMSEFNKMADGLLEKSQVENAFSRYLDKNIARQILNDIENVKLGGKHQIGSVLFADIVGYTSISEKLSADETAQLLNEYFTYIEKASKLYSGTIDKYMGDCAMLVFGIPDKDERHAYNAIACALLIQKVVTELNTQRKKNGLFAVDFRFGVNSGEMLAGNMGSANRMEFTVVGDAVNLASRLCSYSEPGEIIISSDLVNDKFVSENIMTEVYKPIHLRSKEYPIATYKVIDVNSKLSNAMQQHIDEILNEVIAA